MIIKYKNFFTIILTLFLVLICLGGQGFFISTGALDASAIANLDVDNVELGDSYAVMSWLYNHIPKNLLLPITIFCGFLFIKSIYFNAKKKNQVLLLSFMLLVPCILTISSFQKDLILVLFILPVTYLIYSKLSYVKKVLYISIIYLLYALIFRSYYFLITLIFISLYLFKISNGHMRIAIILALISIFLILPNSVYISLQSSRDIVNLDRLGVNDLGNRTAFKNPLVPDSFLNFIYNYIYAFLRLNFGFLFNLTIKDFIFAIYPLIYFYYSLKSLNKKLSGSFLASSLIISHVLVYFLFEPDTGSYARHLSSTLPYLAVIITNLYNED